MTQGLQEAREAADHLAWNHTAAVLAQIYNVNRDAKSQRPIDLAQFFPWNQAGGLRKKKAPPPTEEERKLLRKAFPGNKA